MQARRFMIPKRIEIISSMMVAMVLWAVHAGGRAAVTWPSRYAITPAQTFPVYTEPVAQAMPLDPAADHAELSASESAEDQDFTPDIPYSYFWHLQDGLRLRSAAYAQRQAISEHSTGLLGGFDLPAVETPDTRWQPRPTGGGWGAAAVRWGAQLDDHTELALGNSEIVTPFWNESLRLSGVSLSQSFLASNEDVSQWNYSLALGALDQSASGATDLDFGPTAGTLALNYDYNSRVSLTTRTEVASDLIMSGVAGQYDLGRLGRWRSGVSRSNGAMHQGWRYRAAADFHLAEDLSLLWMGERYTDGFMDINRYAGNSPAAGGRQRWSASWDAGRWGKWSGSFENVKGREGSGQRRFGLSQEFWYSPKLRVGLHAEREVVSDDYDIGLRFSFPLY